ncbi:hypothetical protein JOF28_001960 [Leucobacter exalbidus]|uniref:Uncharacterized protein n=1 Tax=Leucobacter exalbidus TaxID=662960 RepID=A0A940PTW5_9MICO|nr:hypothetical protein [Leucobacter exalbidus]MBP1326728.1 hypothetical protein [Leucobacter exalbidus]
MTGIEFDESTNNVLLVCHDCHGTWRAFAWDMDDAETRAAAHEERCHKESRIVRDRLIARRAQRKKRRIVA